jgi:hypothetical protein
MVSLEKKIQRLQDRVDILELMHAYCRHADTHNAKAMAATLTEDCIVKFVDKSSYIMRGRKSLLDFLVTYFDNVTSGTHYITNAELIFETEDVVTAHMYMFSWERFKGYPVTADCHRFGRYENRFVRTNEGWRISRLWLLSAGEFGGDRIGEHFGRPWPPRFEDESAGAARE